MSANLQLYSKATIYIDGRKAAEAASVSISRSSNASRVNTISGGFRGVSPGSPMIEGTVTSQVPAVGFEFDAGKNIEELIPVELKIFVSGSTLIQNVFIERDSFSYATDGAASIEFSFVGPMAQFIK